MCVNFTRAYPIWDDVPSDLCMAYPCFITCCRKWAYVVCVVMSVCPCRSVIFAFSGCTKVALRVLVGRKRFTVLRRRYVTLVCFYVFAHTRSNYVIYYTPMLLIWNQIVPLMSSTLTWSFFGMCNLILLYGFLHFVALHTKFQQLRIFLEWKAIRSNQSDTNDGM